MAIKQTILSGIRTIKEYGEEGERVTKQLLGHTDWEMKMSYTKTGIVLSIKDNKNDVKHSVLVTSSLTFDELWDNHFQVVNAGVNLFRENRLTLDEIGGPTEQFFDTFEATPETGMTDARHVHAKVCADFLLWKVIADIYLAQMERETKDGPIALLAQKAKVAHAHAETGKIVMNRFMTYRVF